MGILTVSCTIGTRAEAPAGTVIVNVADLTSTGVPPSRVRSNENRIMVAERLDVGLTARDGAAPADGSSVIAAEVTNRGNGGEAFGVTATASAGGDRIAGLAIDSDGDGRYDAGRDRRLEDGRTPALAPGEAATLFVVLAAGTVGMVSITATATTGTGAPGTTFVQGGDGGGDAVVGLTGARASAAVTLTAGVDGQPTLTKSATVTAPDGSARAVGGASIEYTLAARFPIAAERAVIVDPIPVGTTYAPGSLMLDDAPLSDGADADAGEVAAGRVRVMLGDQPAGAVRTVRFKVVIP